MHRNARAWVALLFAAVVVLLLSVASNVCAQVAQATATVAELRIGGEVSTPPGSKRGRPEENAAQNSLYR